MSRRNESLVWNDFEKVEGNKVRCKICNKKLSYSGGSTSSMLHHLQMVHKKLPCQSISSSTRTLGDFGITVGRPCNESRMQLITTSIAKMVAQCNLPFAFVEKEPFRNFLKLLEPNYRPPSAEGIKLRVKKIAEDVRQELLAEVSKADAIALTTDAWTSLANDGFLSVTASFITSQWEIATPVLDTVHLLERHFADYLSQVIEHVAENYTIKERVIAVVHDNAANIAHVATSINKNWEDIGCAAHTFHLCITEAMGMKAQVSNHPIARLVNASSKLVGHFNHSILAANELEKRCKTMEVKSKKPIQYCRTRWNSISDMLERLLELRWPITAVLADKNVTKPADGKILNLKPEMWSTIDALVPLLSALKAVSTIICAEQSISISIVLPLMSALVKKRLLPLDEDVPVLKTFKVNMRSNLIDRFNLESPSLPSLVASISSALDPRHKRVTFLTSVGKEEVYAKIKTLIKTEQEKAATILLSTQSTSAEEKMDDDFFDDGDGEEIKKSEFDIYLDEPAVNKTDCPLKWWQKNEHRLPTIAKIAKRYLCIPATSVASERHFSAAGRLITKSRSSLLPESSACLLFVSQNPHYVK